MTPRAGRVIVEGGIYHVLTRGNNSQRLFYDEADYRRYLALLSSYCATHQLLVRHFALLPTHIHLILEPAQADALSRVMRSLNLAYTLYYQKRHGYQGHLWRGRFLSVPLTRDGELLEHGRQIELHPVRAGLAVEPADYPWSSYRVYAEGVVSPLVEPHDRYHLLGSSPAQRQACYRQFVEDGRSLRPDDAPCLMGHGRRGRPRKLGPAIVESGHVIRGVVLSLLSRIWYGFLY